MSLLTTTETEYLARFRAAADAAGAASDDAQTPAEKRAAADLFDAAAALALAAGATDRARNMQRQAAADRAEADRIS